MKIQRILKQVILMFSVVLFLTGCQHKTHKTHKAVTLEVFQAFPADKDGLQYALARDQHWHVVYLSNVYLNTPSQNLYDGLVLRINQPMIIDLYTYKAGKDKTIKTVPVIGEKSRIDDLITFLENNLKEIKSKKETQEIINILKTLKLSQPY